MKILIAVLFVSSFAVAAPNASKKILPVTKEDEMVKREKLAKEKISALDKKEEDCDKKAEKKVEITPESISLTGNAGCSLDEAH